jgi:hypothetical protein
MEVYVDTTVETRALRCLNLHSREQDHRPIDHSSTLKFTGSDSCTNETSKPLCPNCRILWTLESGDEIKQILGANELAPSEFFVDLFLAYFSIVARSSNNQEYSGQHK